MLSLISIFLLVWVILISALVLSISPPLCDMNSCVVWHLFSYVCDVTVYDVTCDKAGDLYVTFSVVFPSGALSAEDAKSLNVVLTNPGKLTFPLGGWTLIEGKFCCSSILHVDLCLWVWFEGENLTSACSMSRFLRNTYRLQWSWAALHTRSASILSPAGLLSRTLRVCVIEIIIANYTFEIFPSGNTWSRFSYYCGAIWNTGGLMNMLGFISVIPRRDFISVGDFAYSINRFGNSHYVRRCCVCF